MDEKALDATKSSIIDLIEKGINKKYFREDRLDSFFEKCFEMTHDQAEEFAKNPRFQRFLYTDLKTILQVTNKPENLTQWSKFIVFFKVDDDPELIEQLNFKIKQKIKFFEVDDILQVLVNMQHTLSSTVVELFDAVNDEFTERLSQNYNPNKVSLFL